MRLRYSMTVAASLLLLLGLASVAMADTGFTFTMNGANENPDSVTPATGEGFCILNNAETNLYYHVAYRGLLAPRSASHFHGPATKEQNAGVVFGIAGAGPTSGLILGNWAIDAVNKGRLFSELLYLNIHSSAYPGGEIRGQVRLNVTPTQSTTWGRIKKLFR